MLLQNLLGSLFDLFDYRSKGAKQVSRRTGRELLVLQARLFGMSKSEADSRAAELRDELEKTEMEDTRYLNYVEKYPLFVWIALGLVAIEALLRRTLYKSFV